MAQSAVRPSVPGDIPAQRLLWRLAFGDGEDYIDNFYRRYYRPERVLVLEEAGAVRAMTAWFDTDFVLPGGARRSAAYLYAVATHPECRGRGLAGRLLAEADGFFRARGIPAVTTVPAEPSLHRFFARNGFRECFVHRQVSCPPMDPAAPPLPLEPLEPAEYGALREDFLAGAPHIAFPEDALDYQAGCCALSGGGLYRAAAPGGPVLLCVECMEDGTPVVKELLASPEAEESFLARLPEALRGGPWLYRTPERGGQEVPFGMLKWLDPASERAWNWNRTAYLGLAFD